MRKNWLACAEANTVRNGARRVAAAWARGFRQRPLVSDSAFQEAGEPFPGHWRRIPDPWSAGRREHRAQAQAAIAKLPETWRHVLLSRDVHHRSDPQVSNELGLTGDQIRDILTAARAAVRDHIDRAQRIGPER